MSPPRARRTSPRERAGEAFPGRVSAGWRRHRAHRPVAHRGPAASARGAGHGRIAPRRAGGGGSAPRLGPPPAPAGPGRRRHDPLPPDGRPAGRSSPIPTAGGPGPRGAPTACPRTSPIGPARRPAAASRRPCARSSSACSWGRCPPRRRCRPLGSHSWAESAAGSTPRTGMADTACGMILADPGGRGRARMFIDMSSRECEVASCSYRAQARLVSVPRLAARGHLDASHARARGACVATRRASHDEPARLRGAGGRSPRGAARPGYRRARAGERQRRGARGHGRSPRPGQARPVGRPTWSRSCGRGTRSTGRRN
jgi:hypothetical protein